MSYDISIIQEVYNDNYTFNVYKMFNMAIKGGLIALDGLDTKAAIPILEHAIKDMQVKSEEYKGLNPSCGWGNYKGALKVLIDLLDNCRNIDGIINIST